MDPKQQKLSDREATKLSVALARLGEPECARLIGISGVTLLRAATGVLVTPGTVAIIRQNLSKLEGK